MARRLAPVLCCRCLVCGAKLQDFGSLKGEAEYAWRSLSCVRGMACASSWLWTRPYILRVGARRFFTCFAQMEAPWKARL